MQINIIISQKEPTLELLIITGKFKNKVNIINLKKSATKNAV